MTAKIKPGDTAEGRRLAENDRRRAHWNRWGPFLSTRAWGTVREDYSADGAAWDYFPFEQAHTRAYRWNEDGLAGICDRHQLVCFAIALWNGKDPILKERPFGLSNSQGNHGEDVKDYWFYLDATPTQLLPEVPLQVPAAGVSRTRSSSRRTRGARSRIRSTSSLDTGIFADSRYFDVIVEYAKAAPDDVLIAITVANRGPEEATLDLLPTLWFRNTWWKPGRTTPAPLRGAACRTGASVVELNERYLGQYFLHAEPGAELLFTENETNAERVFGAPNPSPYVKDAFHEYVIRGNRGGGQPGAARDEGGGPLPAHARRRRRARASACG